MLLFVILISFIKGIMATRTTSLEPSGNIYLCEGDNVTLQCNVSSGSIAWMWIVNSTEVRVIYSVLDGKTTRTDGSITTQYSGNGSSNLTFQYRVSHLIPSTIICNLNHLVNILTQDKPSFDEFVIINFKRLKLMSTFDLIFGNTSIPSIVTNITILSRNGSINMMSHNNTIYLTLLYNEDYVLNMKSEVCNELFSVTSNIVVQNCSSPPRVFIYLNWNDKDYNYECPYNNSINEFCTMASESDTNCTQGDSILQNYEINYSSNIVTADASEEDSITLNTGLLVSTVILSCGFSCQCIIIVALCAVIITTTKNKRKIINSNVREQMFMKPREIEQIRKDSDDISISMNSAYGIVKRSLLQN